MSSVLVGIDYYLIRRSRWCCCRLYTHLFARLLRSPLHIPRGHLSNLSQLDTQQRHLHIHTTRRNLTGIAQVPCRIGFESQILTFRIYEPPHLPADRQSTVLHLNQIA